MRKSTLTPLCFALILTWENQAHAYLDGNSGSIIIQALIGGLAGMGVLLKMYWHGFLIKIHVRKAVDESEDDDSEVEVEAKSE